MSLYLFQSDFRIIAVAPDSTGASIPIYGDETWTPCGRIALTELAPDVVATAHARGYCLLDVEELPTVRLGDDPSNAPIAA
jgi:hypothetical protein